MKNKTLNRTLLAALVVSSLLSPAVMAACHGTDLNPCPAPFDAPLPDTHSMLTWSQADRVVGFVTTIATTRAMFSATVTPRRCWLPGNRLPTPAIRSMARRITCRIT